MTENIISRRIKQHGADGSVIFVFPSDIAAGLWLEAALAIAGQETFPSKRFVAWDRFKEDAVQATVAGKTPVSAVLRKLYALDLAERNRTAAPHLFSSLIPDDYADSGTLFVSWIARILPQLGIWERKNSKAARSPENKNSETKDLEARDLEARDLAVLKDDYGRFLESHLLFEPSWQRPPLRDTGNRYIIFFPEAIEDFSEYAALLGASPFIETVPVPEPERRANAETSSKPAMADPVTGSLSFDFSDDSTADGRTTGPELVTYENTRHEITSLALEIEKLLRSGVEPEKIAVSVPDLETLEPYLVREFALRSIPVEYRAGFPLGTLPAGRLFSLITECVSSGFSFASMKALLLDRVVPWKNRDMTNGLISFGIRNHCVSSWSENGKNVDVWDEAFRAPTKGEAADWRLAEFYRVLSRTMRLLTAAKSFTEIRKHYFAFRETFLDMSTLSPEDDAVLARCVDELNALASLEGRYAAFIPQQPFAFFVSAIAEKKYVAQRAGGGVSIFPYRVAAGTPYDWHFILDASQDSATVVYSQLAFLRQDRRRALNLLDTDASDAFFSIYYGCGARFSFAERSFSGYRTPHGFFTSLVQGKVSGDDPFAKERDRFSTDQTGNRTTFPDRIHPVQKSGAAAWSAARMPRDFSYLDTPFGDRLSSLALRIASRQMNGTDIRVSQTDLSLFARCNARWFLSRLLAIQAETSDAELLNERNLGILYHDVLKRLYEHIRETDGAFNKNHVAEYKEKASELAGSAAAEHAEFRGPIAEPLIESLVKRIADGIAGIIDKDAELLDGFIPEFLEDDIAFSEGGIRYYGKIDRISRRPSDNLTVLIDYKSGKVPSPSSYKTEGNMPITDFQIPMYVFLAEQSPESPYRGSKIEHAWFAGILEGDYRPIINDNEEISHGRKKGMMTRDEFESAMGSFRSATATFRESVQARDFTRPLNLPASECFSCDFRKICRYTYAVRPR